MKLKKVEIYGFRSIEHMEILFDGNGHKVLVGKNESGKSNILKALYLLSGMRGFEEKDKKEMHQKDAFVSFLFDLEDDEIDEARNEFCEKFLADKKQKLTEEYTIQSFFEEHSKDILYEVVYGKKSSWTYWRIDPKLKLNDKWYSVNECELNEKIPARSYINDEFIKNNLDTEEQEAIKTYIEKITMENIYSFLRTKLKEYVAPDNYTFPVIYWKYNAQEHDLPSYIEKETFIEDTESCIPLKNMFLLSDIQEEEIGSKISEANKLGHNSLRSLLDNVSTKTNEYIENTWTEYAGVKIELRSDGERIVIGIQDSKNTFDFEQRSDGFRRLISFLLLISAENNQENINQRLILIDEPETGLHPSSAKDLRNKLIELGKENLVVYATHSISMIDTENIKNNLIVTKEDENTTFEAAKEDGTSPAESVYQAIGYSIYENLKQTNILLEGYTDKKIFKSFMKGDDWKDFGICYTEGVKNIKNVVPNLELVSRKYFVLSDADEVAQEKKKAMGNPEYWYTYEDLNNNANTIEDFYNESFFKGIVENILGSCNIDHTDIEIPEDKRMKYIKEYIGNSGNIDTKKIKEIIGTIKRECIQNFQGNLNEEKIKSVLNTFLNKIRSSSPN